MSTLLTEGPTGVPYYFTQRLNVTVTDDGHRHVSELGRRIREVDVNINSHSQYVGRQIDIEFLLLPVRQLNHPAASAELVSNEKALRIGRFRKLAHKQQRDHR